MLDFALARYCAGLLLLLLGSDATVVFLEIICDEPSGNTQMALLLIVSAIALSLSFDMDVAFVLQWFPLGYDGFHVLFCT